MQNACCAQGCRPVAPCRFLTPFKKLLLCFLTRQQHSQDYSQVQWKFPSTPMQVVFHQGLNQRQDLAATGKGTAQYVALAYPEPYARKNYILLSTLLPLS